MTCRWASHALLLSLAIAGAVGGCASRGPLHPPNPPGTWYVVKAGETMSSIAAKEGVPVEDLLEINGLARGTVIQEGQILYLLDAHGLRGDPGPVAPSEEPAGNAGAPTPASLSVGPPPGAAPLLRWPLREPRISSSFGFRQGRVHEGIDLPAPTGTPVHAARDGVVLYAGDAVRGYGNMIVLQHEGDLLTVYAHNSVLLVRSGDKVKAGHEIARVGQSGRASAPHLHFEVRKGQVPHDPLRYLPGRK